jgi:hypothetical protein
VSSKGHPYRHQYGVGSNLISPYAKPRSPPLCAHRRYFQTFLVLIVQLWPDAVGVRKCFDPVHVCVTDALALFPVSLVL